MLLILRNNIDTAGEQPPAPIVVSTFGSIGAAHAVHQKPMRNRLPPEVQRLLMAEVRRRVKEELERREMRSELRRATRTYK